MTRKSNPLAATNSPESSQCIKGELGVVTVLVVALTVAVVLAVVT